MRVRFQADADLNLIILLAVTRSEPAVDFQTAEAAHYTRRPDSEVLAQAAKEARVLVTHDQRTMPRHFAEFIRGQTSPGLLVVPQRLSASIAAEDLLVIWGASEAEEWLNRIAYLPL